MTTNLENPIVKKFSDLYIKIFKPKSENFKSEIIISAISCAAIATVSTFFTKGYISIRIISSAFLKGGICYYLIERITTLFNSQTNKIVQYISQKNIFSKKYDEYDKIFIKESLKYNNFLLTKKINTWAIFESSWAYLFKNHFFSLSLIISIINTFMIQYFSILNSINFLKQETLSKKFLSSLYPELEKNIIDNFKKSLQEEENADLNLLDSITNDSSKFFKAYLIAWFLITKNYDDQIWVKTVFDNKENLKTHKEKYMSLSQQEKLNLNLKLLEKSSKEDKQINLSGIAQDIFNKIIENGDEITKKSWFTEIYLPSF